MTAKEFYELNKGKYFMYDGEKVKLVGYRKDYPPKYLIITYSDGWTNEEDYNVIDPSLIDSESLFNGEWRFYYVVERQLNPIEQQEIDLCKILKGCEGITLYSPIFGEVILISINGNLEYPIKVMANGCIRAFAKNGLYVAMFDGECMLFPSKENRDWSTFKKPIKEGLPCMCKNADSDIWVLRTERQASYTYCVPVENFDFKDIENNTSRSII